LPFIFDKVLTTRL